MDMKCKFCGLENPKTYIENATGKKMLCCFNCGDVVVEKTTAELIEDYQEIDNEKHIKDLYARMKNHNTK